MIAGDDLDALYYVDDLLQELGCRPIKVTSAEDAAEIVGAIRLDALIIDLQMFAAASADAIALFLAAHADRPVLWMVPEHIQPDVETSATRCFIAHPPDLAELERALAHCVGAVPARAGR